MQISRMRASLSRPRRSTRTAIDTLSTESRFTALRLPIGSSPDSRITSLGRPRIVVVHGAMSARRSRGIAASRDNTTTGRRPISGSSHHQSSPRSGVDVTLQLRHLGTRRGRPTRRARGLDVDRMRRRRRRSRHFGDARGVPGGLHRGPPNPSSPPSRSEPGKAGRRQRWC